MNPAANVTAVEGIAEYQAALMTFTASAKEALTSVEMDLGRTVEWIDAQARYWEAERRQAEDTVIAARIELARKQMIRIGDRKADTTEEEKNLRRAQAWLDHAEDKLKRTKHWQHVFPEALLEYHGPARQLQFMLEGQVPQMSALLSRKVEVLEQYQQPG